MRKALSLFLPVLILSACSTPRYTYYFDRYDYNSGKKIAAQGVQESDLVIETEMPEFVASIDDEPALNIKRDAPAVRMTTEATGEEQAVIAKTTYKEMNRGEKREFRKQIKNDLKQMMESRKNKGDDAITATTQMDNDLKLAIIFGAVGLTLSLFSGINAAFWVVGVIAIVVGVVFLIRWLVRQ